MLATVDFNSSSVVENMRDEILSWQETILATIDFWQKSANICCDTKVIVFGYQEAFIFTTRSKYSWRDEMTKMNRINVTTPIIHVSTTCNVNSSHFVKDRLI